MLASDSAPARKTAVISTVSGLLFVAALMTAVFRREALDYPVLRLLNLVSCKWPIFDREVLFLASTHVASGVVFVSLLWHAWFRSTRSGYRARILVGTAGAALAGIISRLLQLTLPTHPRPLHDPGLSFLPPSGVDVDVLNHWNSFPSDHAAVFFGLATVLYLASPKLGRWAYAWATALVLARNYLGFHFPSDVVAGGALGALTVSLLQGRRVTQLGCRLVALERSAAPAFYLTAFLLSYQVATLFDEVRSFATSGRQVMEVIKQHFFP